MKRIINNIYYGAMLLHLAGVRHVMLEMKRKLAEQPPRCSYSVWTTVKCAPGKEGFNFVLEDAVRLR